MKITFELHPNNINNINQTFYSTDGEFYIRGYCLASIGGIVEYNINSTNIPLLDTFKEPKTTENKTSVAFEEANVIIKFS